MNSYIRVRYSSIGSRRLPKKETEKAAAAAAAAEWLLLLAGCCLKLHLHLKE